MKWQNTDGVQSYEIDSTEIGSKFSSTTTSHFRAAPELLRTGRRDPGRAPPGAVTAPIPAARRRRFRPRTAADAVLPGMRDATKINCNARKACENRANSRESGNDTHMLPP